MQTSALRGDIQSKNIWKQGTIVFGNLFSVMLAPELNWFDILSVLILMFIFGMASVRPVAAILKICFFSKSSLMPFLKTFFSQMLQNSKHATFSSKMLVFEIVGAQFLHFRLLVF